MKEKYKEISEAAYDPARFKKMVADFKSAQCKGLDIKPCDALLPLVDCYESCIQAVQDSEQQKLAGAKPASIKLLKSIKLESPLVAVNDSESNLKVWGGLLQLVTYRQNLAVSKNDRHAEAAWKIYGDFFGAIAACYSSADKKDVKCLLVVIALELALKKHKASYRVDELIGLLDRSGLQSLKLKLTQEELTTVIRWYCTDLRRLINPREAIAIEAPKVKCQVCGSERDENVACHVCGADANSELRINCPGCGKPLNAQKLSHCGTDRVSCGVCGVPLVHAAEALDSFARALKGNPKQCIAEIDLVIKKYPEWDKPREKKIEIERQQLREEEEKKRREREERARIEKQRQEEQDTFNSLGKPDIINCTRTAGGIRLTWKKVDNADGYYIVRQVGRPPRNEDDAEIPAVRLRDVGSECITDDNRLVCGCRYYYAVYPCRGTEHGKNGIATAKGTVTPPILWMLSPSEVLGIGRDDQITVRWKLEKISSQYSVRLIRRHDGHEEEIKLKETEYLGPFRDRNVTKGSSYSYRVVVNVGGLDFRSDETMPIVAETPLITCDVVNREFVRMGRRVLVSWSWVQGVDSVIVSHTGRPQGTDLPLSSLVEGRDFDICRRSDNLRNVEVMLKGAQTFIGVYPYNEVEARAAEPDRPFLAEQRRVAVTTKRSWLGRCEALVFEGLQKGAHGGWLPEFVINARDVERYTVEEIGRSSEIDAAGRYKVPDRYRKGYEFTFECKSKTDNSNYSFEKR